MLAEHQVKVFQDHRIGCVWKTPFRKSNHNYTYNAISDCCIDHDNPSWLYCNKSEVMYMLNNAWHVKNIFAIFRMFILDMHAGVLALRYLVDKQVV